MSLPKRDIPRPSNLPVAVDELYGIMRLRAWKSTGFPVNILAENDGTLRSQSILFHSGTTQIRQKAETDGTATSSLYGKNAGTLTAFNLESTGEQRNVLMGHDGAALQRLKVETTRELDVVFEGKDSGGTVDPLRTNDNQQLFYELYEHWKQVDPYQVTAADAIAYNPGSTATETYSVVITVYVTAAVAAVVTVYVDVAAGGTAGGNEYLMNAESVAAKTRVTLPEIIIGGDDDIRAFSTAGSDAALHFRVKQVART